MTPEEIKENKTEGVVYIDVFGHYWKKVGLSWYCMFKTCNSWNEYPHHLPLPELEPL